VFFLQPHRIVGARFSLDFSRMFDRFDILRKLGDGGIVWIESANDLQTAKQRIKVFAANKPGEYIVFCQVTGSIVATEISKLSDE
jgi:hypothetical protein